MKHTPRYSTLLSGLFIICSLAICTSSSGADEWTSETNKQHLPGSPENRIIKWCSTDGTKVRYASANLKIKEFEPCGTVNTTATCDPSGNRFISKDSERPPAHLDCAVGPRIYVVAHHKDEQVDTSSLALSAEQLNALAPDERESLKRDLQQIEKDQEHDPSMQLQQSLAGLLQGYFGKSAGINSRSKSRAAKAPPQDPVNQLLDQLSPDSRKQLEGLLGISSY